MLVLQKYLRKDSLQNNTDELTDAAHYQLRRRKQLIIEN